MMGNDDEIIIREHTAELHLHNQGPFVPIAPIACGLNANTREAHFQIGPFASFGYTAEALREVGLGILRLAKEMERGK